MLLWLMSIFRFCCISHKELFYINSVFKGEEIVWLRCHSAVLLDPQS